MKGNLEIVKFLVKLGANVETENNYRRRPLSIAAMNGRLDVVKYFVEECYAYVNARDKNEYAAIHNARKLGQFDVVEYLKSLN